MASVNRVETAQSAYDTLLTEWTRLTSGPASVSEWEEQLERALAEEHNLRERGLWKSGSKTLLSAIGVHYREVYMCGGLAWLLRPDGWHGLGSSVLAGLLSHLGVRVDSVAIADVVAEEVRADTRADIIIRLPSATVLIEAKLYADEQPRQADRLAALWDDESPTLVFLTRTGRLPRTAVDSEGRWKAITWRTLAAIIREAIRARAEAAPGAKDLLATLELYGG